MAGTALLAGFAEELGQSARDVLEGTGLDPATLRDPRARVAAEQELTVVRNLLRHRPGADPGALGLAAGARYHATSYGVWGYAVTSCGTVQEAVDLALRYVELTYVFCLPELRTGGPLAELRCHDDEVPADVRAFLVARDVAAIVTLVREQAGTELHPTALSLRVPEPADAGPYRAALGVDPEFGDRTAITFPHEVLNRTMPQASVHTLAWCEQQCQEMLDALRRGTDVATLARRALADVGLGAGMAEVAARLAMTERTLRRRLAAEGVSYRGLVDEVRRGRAAELVDSGVLTVEQISQRLGYSEASSFLHAFTRWYAASPREFRSRTGSARPPGGH